MVTPYMAGMVNHATNNETAKITDTIYLPRDTVMKEGRGWGEESNIVLEGTEKLLKRENQGWKQEEQARDIKM